MAEKGRVRTKLQEGKGGMERMDVHFRIMEWLGFEGSSKIIKFQPPAMGRDPSHYPRLL